MLKITFREQNKVMSEKKGLAEMLENAGCVLEAGGEVASQTRAEVSGMNVNM